MTTMTPDLSSPEFDPRDELPHRGPRPRALGDPYNTDEPPPALVEIGVRGERRDHLADHPMLVGSEVHLGQWRAAGTDPNGPVSIELGHVLERLLDGLPPIGALSAPLIPFLTHERRLAEETVDALGIRPGPEGEHGDERQVGRAVVAAVVGDITRIMETSELDAVPGGAGLVEQGSVLAREPSA